MAVYVDDAIWAWQGRKWCHLLADEIDELHRFARTLGLSRASYQGPPKTWIIALAMMTDRKYLAQKFWNGLEQISCSSLIAATITPVGRDLEIHVLPRKN